MSRYTKSFTFDYYVWFGAGDASDTLEWEAEMFDSEYSLLKANLRAGKEYDDLVGLQRLQSRMEHQIEDEERGNIASAGLEYDGDPFNSCSLRVSIPEEAYEGRYGRYSSKLNALYEGAALKKGWKKLLKELAAQPGIELDWDECANAGVLTLESLDWETDDLGGDAYDDYDDEDDEEDEDEDGEDDGEDEDDEPDETANWSVTPSLYFAVNGKGYITKIEPRAEVTCPGDSGLGEPDPDEVWTEDAMEEAREFLDRIAEGYGLTEDE